MARPRRDGSLGRDTVARAAAAVGGHGDEENYVNIYKNGLLILGVMGEHVLHRLALRRSPKFGV
jgi:hypothetical protein